VLQLQLYFLQTGVIVLSNGLFLWLLLAFLNLQLYFLPQWLTQFQNMHHQLNLSTRVSYLSVALQQPLLVFKRIGEDIVALSQIVLVLVLQYQLSYSFELL